MIELIMYAVIAFNLLLGLFLIWYVNNIADAVMEIQDYILKNANG